MSNAAAAAVAARVRGRMAELDINQQEMARLLGISQAAISRRLSADVTFDVAELDVVAKHLGVSIRYFLEAAEAAS